MGLNWLQSLIYGLISGFTEFLPISSDGHRIIFLELIGAADSASLRLSSRIGALLALIFLCAPMIAKLNRERKIASITEKRRKRQPDMRSVMDLRVLKTAVFPVILGTCLCAMLSAQGSKLWLLAILLFANGCVMYFPQFYPHANKDSLSLTSADSVLIGIGAGIGSISGLSSVGVAASIGSVRGADRRYILDIILILCVPALLILILLDFFAALGAVAGLTFLGLICCITAALMSFIGAYFGIYMMRFIAVRVGYSGFAFYSWGLALLTFILYLTIS